MGTFAPGKPGLHEVKNAQILKLMRRHGYVRLVADELGVTIGALSHSIGKRGLRARALAERNKYTGPKLAHNTPTVIKVSNDEIVEAVAINGSIAWAAKALGLNPNTLSSHINRDSSGLKARVQAVYSPVPPPPRINGVKAPTIDLTAAIQQALKKGKPYQIDDLADAVDASPRRVRDALDQLREAGYNIPAEQDIIVLAKVEPSTNNLHKSLLEGKTLRVGLVSDTHLSSKECALPELELAYSIFEDEGIKEVWHAGDFTCGYGIFRTQAMEVINHTFEDQVDYLVQKYPVRKGITTRGISGNHDVEGEFGKIGANPVVALANQREDVEFLGNYSAWVELPGGSFVHLLHGKGGGSYAFSYQAQKLVDSYPSGRKPVILAVGHFHRKDNIEARGVEVLWPGCTEWASPFLMRLGLTPAVGFYILDMTIGDDGTLVKFVPTWYRFFQGRTVIAKAIK